LKQLTKQTNNLKSIVIKYNTDLSKDLIEKWRGQVKNTLLLKKRFKAISKLNVRSSIAKAEKIDTEVFEEMDCLECANCCKSIPPILSNRDVKRISKHVGMTKSQFAEKYLITDEDGDVVMNTSPCPFLQEDNKCEIYDFRPTACRQYPHSGEGQFFQNLSLHKRNVKYCPALFEITKRLEAL